MVYIKMGVMLAPYRILTKVPYGGGNELRKWCRENIGEPYRDWETYPADDVYNECIGVKVFTEEHAALVMLRWA